MDTTMLVIASLLSVCTIVALLDAIIFNSKHLDQFSAYVREKLSTKPVHVEKRKEKILTKIAEKGIPVVKPPPKNLPQKKKLSPQKQAEQDLVTLQQRILTVLDNTPHEKHREVIAKEFKEKPVGRFYENENSFHLKGKHFQFEKDAVTATWKIIPKS